MKLATILAASLLAAPAITAQQVAFQQKSGDTLIFNRQVSPPQAGVRASTPGMNFVQLMADAAVKGAPYSAEAVTETVQTLSDGNRISNKNSVRMYRDSDGRTRMESTFQPVGPWVADGKNMVITAINDPVSGEHYVLNNDTKTATKAIVRTSVTTRSSETSADGKVTRESHREVRVMSSGTNVITEDVAGVDAGAAGAVAGGPAVIHFSGVAAAAPMNIAFGASGEAQSASLGKRPIEGVDCEGTRTTLTIPAGQIGNERAIEVVTETWHSPELKMDLLRKHTDPRFGETTYRVTGLVRTEQPRNLFEIPPDFKTDEINTRTPNIEPLRKKLERNRQPELF